MNKAFTKESEADDLDDDDVAGPAIPAGTKNYITRAGYERLRAELLQLIDEERPEVVRVVHWAASNGDRSENGDYIYGKKRLREIDKRIRFLTKRLDSAEVVDVERTENTDRIFFGATVVYADSAGHEHTITIVGVDEVDPANRRVSWVSPIAMALRGAREGDLVNLRTPNGAAELEVIEIRYGET
ncbi:transcription elongation factor GreB [soil metagenome]